MIPPTGNGAVTRRTSRCQEPRAHLTVSPCGYTSGFVEDTWHDENDGGGQNPQFFQTS